MIIHIYFYIYNLYNNNDIYFLLSGTIPGTININSDVIMESNKIINIFSAGYLDNFDIRHSGITEITREMFPMGINKFFTIEPGKYRVTFQAVKDYSNDFEASHIVFYQQSGASKFIYNTADGNYGNISLETVTHEIDFSNIGNFNNTLNRPYQILIIISSKIIFEPL